MVRLLSAWVGWSAAIVSIMCAVLLSQVGSAKSADAGAAAEVKDEASLQTLLMAAPHSRKGADTCLACHNDAATHALFQGVHGDPRHSGGPFGSEQLQCEACHGPGGNHAGRVRRGQQRPELIGFSHDALAPTELQNDQCLSCHAQDVGGSVDAWSASAHDERDFSCAACHTSHAAKDSVLTTTEQASVCYACHSAQRAAGHKAFAHPLDEQKMNCSACHSIHDAQNDALLNRPTVNQTCHQCHAEMRGPFLWEHAPVTEDCGICHDAHGSNHPGMLTRRGPFLCQACHSEAGHPSLTNDGRGTASGTPSQFLLGRNCMNCHSQVHGSNHPSGSRLAR